MQRGYECPPDPQEKNSEVERRVIAYTHLTEIVEVSVRYCSLCFQLTVLVQHDMQLEPSVQVVQPIVRE